MAELFATSKQTISYHVINILKDRGLNKIPVVKEFLTTAADGKNYNVVFYSLEMIIAVGYRVRGCAVVILFVSYYSIGLIIDSMKAISSAVRPYFA